MQVFSSSHQKCSVCGIRGSFSQMFDLLWSFTLNQTLPKQQVMEVNNQTEMILMLLQRFVTSLAVTLRRLRCFKHPALSYVTLPWQEV